MILTDFRTRSRRRIPRIAIFIKPPEGIAHIEEAEQVVLKGFAAREKKAVE